MAVADKPSFRSQVIAVAVSVAFSVSVICIGGYGSYVRLEETVETLESQKDNQQHEMLRLTDRLDAIEDATNRIQEDVSWMRARDEAELRK